MCLYKRQIHICPKCYDRTTRRTQAVCRTENCPAREAPPLTITQLCKPCITKGHSPHSPKPTSQPPAPTLPTLPMPGPTEGPPPNYAEATVSLPPYDRNDRPIPYKNFMYATANFTAPQAAEKWSQTHLLHTWHFLPLANKILNLQSRVQKLGHKLQALPDLRTCKNLELEFESLGKPLMEEVRRSKFMLVCAGDLIRFLDRERAGAVEAAAKGDGVVARRCATVAREIEDRLFEIYVEAGRVRDPVSVATEVAGKVRGLERRVWALEGKKSWRFW